MGLVVTRWQKYGHDRVYVREEDGRESLGYFDYKVGRLALNPMHEERTYEVIEVLRPFMGPAVPEPLSEPTPEAPLPGESGLPMYEPGDADESGEAADEAIGARVAQLRPRGFQGFQGIAARFLGGLGGLGARTEAGPWEGGAKSDRIVDKQLGKLKLDGWQVLSSVLRNSGADVDHLVIGPPGVFTINVKHHHGARVWVGEQVVDVDGEHHRYLPNSRHEANSAARILNDAVGLPVRVTPVLAFVGAASIDTNDSLGDVLIARGEEIDYVLRDLHAVYSVQERDRVYGVARRAELWLA
jgi:Nuclease-related domain